MSREDAAHIVVRASMKALPKRKGNTRPPWTIASAPACLNESPSEKEGKFWRMDLGLKNTEPQ